MGDPGDSVVFTSPGEASLSLWRLEQKALSSSGWENLGRGGSHLEGHLLHLLGSGNTGEPDQRPPQCGEWPYVLLEEPPEGAGFTGVWEEALGRARTHSIGVPAGDAEPVG